MLHRGFCYVAEAENRLVGTAFGNHNGAFSGYISKLAVDDAWRRKKIATALVQKIMERFEEAGIPLTYVHVEKETAASLQLFKALGFEIRDTHYLLDSGYRMR